MMTIIDSARTETRRSILDTRGDGLRRAGQLSSVTILFILHDWLTKRTMASGADGLVAAFGPGFSA